MFRVPTIETGTTGTPASMASVKLPRLNSPTSPVMLRVPSGKSTREMHCRFSFPIARVIDFLARRAFSLSIQIWPIAAIPSRKTG